MCEPLTDDELRFSSLLHTRYVELTGTNPMSPLMVLLRSIQISSDNPRRMIDDYYRQYLQTLPAETRFEPCRVCLGDGSVETDVDELSRCVKCDGTGYLTD